MKYFRAFEELTKDETRSSEKNESAYFPFTVYYLIQHEPHGRNHMQQFF
jgi:hypothetical protein